MNRTVLAIALGACGGPATPSPATPATATPTSARASDAPTGTARTAVDCDAVRAEGIELRTAGKRDDAVAAFERGLAACGDGHGLHDELGFTLAGRQQLDDAAKHYIAELRAPHAAPSTFAHLNAIYDQLTSARKLEIGALGTSADAPIKVPEIRFEYGWIGWFACPGGAGKVTSQALITNKTGQLDALAFDCPDSKDHHVYFDFSDDPSDKALREQLKLDKPAKQP
jgi:hypothetical protein